MPLLNDLFKHSNKGCFKIQQVNFKQAGQLFVGLLLLTAPHTTTGQSPSMLFMGGNQCTKLDLLKPDVRKRVEDKQLNQAAKSQNPAPNFQIGQNVVARNYRGGDKWVPGIIAAQTGPLSYQVRVASNTVWNRHADQLRATGVKADIHEEQPGRTPKPDDENARNINPDISSEETPTDNPSNKTTQEEPRPPCNTDRARRYPAHERRAPVKLNL